MIEEQPKSRVMQRLNSVTRCPCEQLESLLTQLSSNESAEYRIGTDGQLTEAGTAESDPVY